MRLLKLKKGLFSVVLLMGLSVPSFAQKSNAQKAENTATYILDIDANYMKEHIFDYEANPRKFVYKGNKPAIIDFHAHWCGPCRKLSPILKKVVKEYNGKVMLYKIDVDSQRELAMQFNVQSIPMLIYISADGKPHQTLGFLTEKELRAEIAKIVK